MTTLWGNPGEADWCDGTLRASRFSRPTYLAVWPPVASTLPWAGRPDFLVADSGNQVIRSVDLLGRVTTLAGVPGRAGHQDATDPHRALFSEPMGLGCDEGGSVYVADQGNHAVRRIAPGGAVSTLAGCPGRPGFQDGRGAEARFSSLRGLAVRPGRPGRSSCTIYVVDGHSLRMLTPAGEVTTLCGHPAVPGAGPVGIQTPVPGVPCFNNPQGLAVAGKDLLVADLGNHALQIVRAAAGAPTLFATLAGDPTLATTRYGLLRFGIRGPLADGYGALGEPWGVAVSEDGRQAFVSDGPSLALCSAIDPPWGLAKPGLGLAPEGQVVSGVPLELEFSGPRPIPVDPTGYEPEELLPYFWTLDVLAPGTGQRLGTLKGKATGLDRARLTFEDRGTVIVQLTCVTEDGYSDQVFVNLHVE